MAKKESTKPEVITEMRALLEYLSLNTVCKSARCPTRVTVSKEDGYVSHHG